MAVSAAPAAPEVAVLAAPAAPEVAVSAAPAAPEATVFAIPAAPEVAVSAAPAAPEATVLAAPTAPDVTAAVAPLLQKQRQQVYLSFDIMEREMLSAVAIGIIDVDKTNVETLISIYKCCCLNLIN